MTHSTDARPLAAASRWSRGSSSRWPSGRGRRALSAAGPSRCGQIGTVILDMIKGLAGPLLLFAVLDAFLRTEVRRRRAASWSRSR